MRPHAGTDESAAVFPNFRLGPEFLAGFLFKCRDGVVWSGACKHGNATRTDEAQSRRRVVRPPGTQQGGTR